MQCIWSRSSCQVAALVKSFGQAAGLPFANLLRPEDLSILANQATGRIYTPMVTLWMFLSQVLSSDRSCSAAVARLLEWRLRTGADPCSANNGAYCKAREKLRETDLQQLAVQSGERLAQQAPDEWLWKNKRVFLLDGTTYIGPDTSENQREYPQPDGQKPGLGFPMLRAVGLICMVTGALRSLAMGAYSGKGTGEVSLLRQIWDFLQPDDVVIGDAIYCCYPEIGGLISRGVDVVLHKHGNRKTDFRRGKRLGKGDHIVVWQKPATRPARLTPEEWDEVPHTITLRESRVQLQRHGYRTKVIVVITTLQNPETVTTTELGELYAHRWDVEGDLRSIKCQLGMSELRGRTPSMLRREVWVSLLAYNLLRGHMAAAAQTLGTTPRHLSFCAARQTLNSFLALFSLCGTNYPEIFSHFLVALAAHRVRQRPGRQEPRKLKRRKNQDRLTEKRSVARSRIKKMKKL